MNFQEDINTLNIHIYAFIYSIQLIYSEEYMEYTERIVVFFAFKFVWKHS